MKLLFVVVALAMLTGCTTMSAQESSTQDDQTCRGYGVKIGSDAYVACRMQLTENHHEDDQRRRTNMEVLSARLVSQN